VGFFVNWAESHFDQLAEAVRFDLPSEFLTFDLVDQAGMPEPLMVTAVAAKREWRRQRFAATWAQCGFSSDDDDLAALRVAAEAAAIAKLPRRGADPLTEARLSLSENLRAQCVRIRQDTLASARSAFESMAARTHPDSVGIDLSDEEVFYRECAASLDRLERVLAGVGFEARVTDAQQFTLLLASRSDDVQLLVLPRAPSSFFSGVPLDMSVAAYLGSKRQGSEVRTWSWVDLVSLAPALDYVCMVRTVPGLRACSEFQWGLIRSVVACAADAT
jgi:hypothetical protein